MLCFYFGHGQQCSELMDFASKTADKALVRLMRSYARKFSTLGYFSSTLDWVAVAKTMRCKFSDYFMTKLHIIGKDKYVYWDVGIYDTRLVSIMLDGNYSGSEFTEIPDNIFLFSYAIDSISYNTKTRLYRLHSSQYKSSIVET